jgi:hypothetical protein
MDNLNIVGIIVLSVLVGTCLGMLFMWIRYSLSSMKKDIDRKIEETSADLGSSVGGAFTEIETVKKDFNVLIDSIKKDLENSIDKMKTDNETKRDRTAEALDRQINESIEGVYQSIKNAEDEAKSYADSKCDKLVDRLKNKN